MSEMVGRVLEGYRIEAELGRGGQAVVYRATQLSLQRTVALKVVSPLLSSDENFKERFAREGIAAASLDHPHVIPVFEAGEADGLAFLAMKYIDGPSFDAVLHQPGGIEPRRTLAILRQVAEALDYMAARGMVHRDVKPANVLLGPGDHAYLSDFGLIKAISAARLTSSGVWMGTLEYVAPEQIRGGPITPAADRYALAAVAFEALTGQALFPREDRTATLFAHVNDEPPAASGINPALGAPVDAVLARGLAKDPDGRYPSAVALVEDLSEAIMATPGAAAARPPAAVVAPPPPPPPVASDPGSATVTDEPSATPVPDPAATVPPQQSPSDPPADPARAPSVPSEAPTDDHGARHGSDQTRLVLMIGGAIVVALLIVLGVMLASGTFSGSSRTVTTYVVDTSTRPVTTSPAGDTLGGALPGTIAGWTLTPAGPELPNIGQPPDAVVETAQAVRGDDLAMVAAARIGSGGSPAAALANLSSAVTGTDLGDPQLGPAAETGWVRSVLDGTAVGFSTEDRVFLVLSDDTDVALELARQLTSG